MTKPKINKVEFQGEYPITLENDTDKEKSCIGIENFSLMFTSKKSVQNHIKALEKALEFWEYDND
jgi:hypothetical protein